MIFVCSFYQFETWKTSEKFSFYFRKKSLHHWQTLFRKLKLCFFADIVNMKLIKSILLYCTVLTVPIVVFVARSLNRTIMYSAVVYQYLHIAKISCCCFMHEQTSICNSFQRRFEAILMFFDAKLFGIRTQKLNCKRPKHFSNFFKILYLK